VVHGPSLATITERWLGDIPFVQVNTTWASTCPETVHQRPCMTREIKTWQSDSRVSSNTVMDHRSRRPVLSPLHNCVDRCHVWVWPYWASKCKPWRWMLKDHHHHFICPIIQQYAHLHEYGLEEQDSKVSTYIGQFGWALIIWTFEAYCQLSLYFNTVINMNNKNYSALGRVRQLPTLP